MITTQFDYVAPTTLDEAVRQLSSNPDARPIAGGQGLLHSLKQTPAGPKLLIDLGLVGDLRGLKVEKDSLYIGAMATLAELL
ncbi:MAG: FAD binding domain-containing protein, partial [Thermoanaerobaculia bacterium]